MASGSRCRLFGRKLDDELAVRDTLMGIQGGRTLRHDIGKIFKNTYQLFVLPGREPAKAISTRLICTEQIKSIPVASLAPITLNKLQKKLEPTKRPFNAKQFTR